MILRGRKVYGGKVEAEVLVTRERISGWGGMDPRSGTIIEIGHELRGKSFAGKILVFPGAKGSSAWSHYFHLARLAGKAPAGLVIGRICTRSALGAAVLKVPAITECDPDPLAMIRSGQRVRLDADAGWIEILD
jgi:predicted aconitase with swiveling domain